jgi:protein-disulfide isomerase
MENDKKKTTSMLDQLPPKFAFWGGIVLSAGVFSVITLIVMAVIFFGGDRSLSTTTDTVEETATEEAAPTPSRAPAAAPSKPKPSGTVDMAALTNVRGSGDITVVEYSDTECPFCKRFHPTMQKVVEEYDGKVAWGYKHFPLLSLHPKAQRESEATECAAEQKKFWEYTDLLFEKTPANNKLEDDQLFAFADEVGLDRKQFDDCLESGKYTEKVKADTAEAQQMGGTGTPYSVIVDENGKVLDAISGALPYESLQTALDQYVK